MGLFDKIFRPRDRGTPVQADTFWQTFTAYQPQFYSAAGQVYEILLVRAAIDFRARQNAKLKVEQRGSANERLRALIRHKPSEWQTWYHFLYRVSTILDVQNNCIIVPVLDDFGRVTGFYPVLPSVTEIVSVDGEPFLRYQFRSGQVAAMELRRCGILNKYQYLSDFFGEDNKAQERFSKTSMSGTGGVILFPSTYADVQQIKSSAYSVDQAELDLINGNVYSYFGVNDKLLQSLATADELDGFFNCCVEPFEIQLSEALTEMTFSAREQTNGNRIDVTANRLQYASLSQRIDMARELGDRGMIMRDEIRELFNLPPLPDGIGQTAPVRGEYYNAGDTRPADKEADDEQV